MRGVTILDFNIKEKDVDEEKEKLIRIIREEERGGEINSSQ